jgi:hypothetical protein
MRVIIVFDVLNFADAKVAIFFQKKEAIFFQKSYKNCNFFFVT